MSERDELYAEREFQDFLKRRRSPFPIAADSIEPPEDLDRWVLQRARDGIRAAAPPKPLKTSYWAIPFATAATVVIALGIFLNADAPSPTTTTPGVAAIPAARDTSEALPAAPPPESTVTIELRAETDTPAAAAEVAIVPAPAPSQSSERERRAMEPAAVARAAPKVSAEFAPPPPTPRPAAPPPAAMADAAANAANAAIVADPAASERASADDSFAVAAQKRESAPIGSPNTQSVGAAAGLATETPAYRRDADRWWAEIKRLQAVGDSARVERELAEFRKAYPDYERGILTPAKP